MFLGVTLAAGLLELSTAENTVRGWAIHRISSHQIPAVRKAVLLVGDLDDSDLEMAFFTLSVADDLCLTALVHYPAPIPGLIHASLLIFSFSFRLTGAVRSI